jgi:hypothetical protein
MHPLFMDHLVEQRQCDLYSDSLAAGGPAHLKGSAKGRLRRILSGRRRERDRATIPSDCCGRAASAGLPSKGRAASAGLPSKGRAASAGLPSKGPLRSETALPPVGRFAVQVLSTAARRYIKQYCVPGSRL